MSSYVHNYVICDEKAKRRLTNLAGEDFCMLHGYYDDAFNKISDNKYLVTFDTRGPEYSPEFIIDFIEKHKSTLWYCIEENVLEEGLFFWNGSFVELKMRVLTQKISENEFLIEYRFNSFKPLYVIFISDTQIVIEDVLKFEKRQYSFGQASGEKIGNYAKSLLADLEKGLEAYIIFPEREVEADICCSWDEKFDSLEHFTSKSPDENEIGTKKFYHFFEFFNSILADEGIDEDLTFDGLSEEFADKLSEKLSVDVELERHRMLYERRRKALDSRRKVRPRFRQIPWMAIPPDNGQ